MKRGLCLILLCLVGIVVYSNTFDAPFQWDENLYIVGNPIIRDLGFFIDPLHARGLEYYQAFVDRYVGYLSFALDYRFHGLGVTGYHIVNITIHLLNAVLLYLFVTLLLKTPVMERSQLAQRAGSLAFFTALLFVSHPLQTEAVTYIFQRFASLVAFFYLLSIVSYILSRQSCAVGRRPVYYIVSLVSALLAMKTKENAFTLPIMITFCEFLFFTGPAGRRVVLLLPFLLSLAVIPLSVGSIKKPVSSLVNVVNPALKGYENMLRSEYFFTQCRVIVTYLRLLLLPVNQNISHQYPIFPSFFLLPIILSFLFLIAIIASAVYLLFRSAANPDLRLAGFGILWFFITISIESGVIPIPMVINEYRIYLPSVGLFIAFASAVFLLLARLTDRRARIAAVACAAVLVLLLSAGAYERNEKWRSRTALWEDTVSKSPYDPRARFNLGAAYLNAGAPDKAIGQFQAAIELYPVYPDAYFGIGTAYDMMRMPDEAIPHYESAIGQAPGYVAAYYRLATDYELKGEKDKATSIYETIERRGWESK